MRFKKKKSFLDTSSLIKNVISLGQRLFSWFLHTQGEPGVPELFREKSLVSTFSLCNSHCSAINQRAMLNVWYVNHTVQCAMKSFFYFYF